MGYFEIAFRIAERICQSPRFQQSKLLVQSPSIQGTSSSEGEHMKKTHSGMALFMLLAPLLIGLTAFEAQATRVRGGVTLKPLDAATVDDVLQSSNGTTHATIKFVNQSHGAVDIYWINYEGHRVLYVAGLAAGSSCTIATFLTHPWLVVASDTGGTTASDTGIRLAGFEALTANGDTAVITN